MEKPTPHYALSKIHLLVRLGKVRATVSATSDAASLGVFGLKAMCAVVLAPTRRDFYKSMTTHADHRIWQDVYHGQCSRTRVYVKLTVVDDVLIVSFKRL